MDRVKGAVGSLGAGTNSWPSAMVPPRVRSNRATRGGAAVGGGTPTQGRGKAWGKDKRGSPGGRRRIRRHPAMPFSEILPIFRTNLDFHASHPNIPKSRTNARPSLLILLSPCSFSALK